ncbi:hypothetical protein CDD82_683 [Ophiocordyceps australis]|uniref:Major facilitator superfamily (MFS) profile domain-containing protein n=1 Tax=Ophiocordyceps australis TaxID=1399860 RepID=A0A2C5YKY0_9HYPO|nr:hypothetical protein CDD82_683 [Ophiocordyceps australis]
MAQDSCETTDDSRGGEFVKTAEVRVRGGTEFEQAIENEHQLGFAQAVRLYPKAIGWCLFVSIGIIMIAFDQQLLGNLYSTPQFQRDFGRPYGDEWVIDASWQTALSMGSPMGQVVGALVGVYPMDRFGRKPTFAGTVVVIGALVLIQFFARSLTVLLVGELLAGLVAGVFVVLTPAYASEVCPTALRGHTTATVNLCFVIGELLANGVEAGTQHLRSHWAYSLPFVLQWFWIVVLVVGMLRVPESPWWLVRQGRLDDARAALRKLSSGGVDVEATLTVIIETNRLEQELEAGSTYADCFRSVNRRRTEIAFGVYCTQVLSGIYLISYSTFFSQQAGLGNDDSFNIRWLPGHRALLGPPPTLRPTNLLRGRPRRPLSAPAGRRHH